MQGQRDMKFGFWPSTKEALGSDITLTIGGESWTGLEAPAWRNPRPGVAARLIPAARRSDVRGRVLTETWFRDWGFGIGGSNKTISSMFKVKQFRIPFLRPTASR